LSEDDFAVLSQVVFVLVIVVKEGLVQSVEFGRIFLSDIGDGDAGGRLFVHQLSKSGLALDEAVRDVFVSAEVGEPHNQFNGINVVGNNDELRLFLFNESGHVVESALEELWLGGFGSLLRFSILILRGFGETGFLLSTGLGFVFSQELEESLCFVSGQSVAELIDHWRNLQSLEENSLLSLQKDVLGPLYESRHVSLRLNVSSNLEDSASALEKIAELLFLLGGFDVSFLVGLTFCHDGFIKFCSLKDYFYPKDKEYRE